MALDAGNANSWYLLGRCKYNEKHFEEPRNAFEHSLKLEPANGKADDYLGSLLRTFGQDRRSAGGLSDGGRARGLAFGPIWIWERCWWRAAGPEEAIGPLVRAVELAPDNADAHRELGKAYLALHHLEQAQRELEKAVALAPEQCADSFLLAQVFRKRGLNAKADAETAQLCSFDGGSFRARDSAFRSAFFARSGKAARSEKALCADYLQHASAIGRGAFSAGLCSVQRAKRHGIPSRVHRRGEIPHAQTPPI